MQCFFPVNVKVIMNQNYSHECQRQSKIEFCCCKIKQIPLPGIANSQIENIGKKSSQQIKTWNAQKSKSKFVEFPAKRMKLCDKFRNQWNILRNKNSKKSTESYRSNNPGKKIIAGIYIFLHEKIFHADVAKQEYKHKGIRKTAQQKRNYHPIIMFNNPYHKIFAKILK